MQHIQKSKDTFFKKYWLKNFSENTQYILFKKKKDEPNN